MTALTSLIKNQVYTTSDQLKMANIRNVLQPRLLTACGVIWEKVKLNSHWVAVPTAIPPSRILVGKISLMYTQGTGPQEMLYVTASR